jgi:V/A-type H+-transporting ATPase subunit I
LAQGLFYEELLHKIDGLLASIPEVSVREVYLAPQVAIDSVAELVPKHVESCESLIRRREALQTELRQLNRYAAFLSDTEPLLKEVGPDTGLDFVAVEVKSAEALEEIRRLVARLHQERYHMQTARRVVGTFIALIATESDKIGALREALRGEQVPELSLPLYLEALPFTEKIIAARRRLTELAAAVAAAEREMAVFAQRWAPIYRKVREWLTDWVALHKTSASLFETEMCFVIYGWMPSEELPGLRKMLTDRFAGQVVVEEKQILEQDLERVPVVLENPPYFKPFELFARLLPLPAYSSFDPTPFLGIFFPVFFGMILGDMGYGLFLALVALAIIRLFRRRPNVQSAGKILLISSAYTIFFGWLFGECFGEQVAEALGFHPICFDRRKSIMTTIYFALSVGIVHVSLGLFLGFVSALKRRLQREALFKLVTIIFILCLVVLGVAFLVPGGAAIRKSLLVALLIAGAAALIFGGLLAPLELFKTFGNIISYSRIMAIGLTSVLLAYIANELAGHTGSVVAGVVVAILLHAVNIVIGVFAPTIHSLRLHYVEFFSKFMEPGGREFRPLEKTQ